MEFSSKAHGHEWTGATPLTQLHSAFFVSPPPISSRVVLWAPRHSEPVQSREQPTEADITEPPPTSLQVTAGPRGGWQKFPTHAVTVDVARQSN